jgi:hypothetical protein
MSIVSGRGVHLVGNMFFNSKMQRDLKIEQRRHI